MRQNSDCLALGQSLDPAKLVAGQSTLCTPVDALCYSPPTYRSNPPSWTDDHPLHRSHSLSHLSQTSSPFLNSDWSSNFALAQSVPNRWWAYRSRDHPVIPLTRATSPCAHVLPPTTFRSPTIAIRPLSYHLPSPLSPALVPLLGPSPWSSSSWRLWWWWSCTFTRKPIYHNFGL
jgi:hypothetical protein